ncbi:MAG: hypothetical protein M1365_15490 [Actinobacteria bacterium]|nr:hypothetical protein [Actinomycetota bacterium]
MSKRYLEQYERTKRWYVRLKNVTEGREHNLPSDYYQDDVLAFFINCYHIKDWIKNSKSASSKEVEDFVSQSEFLRVCGDVCNGSKHLTLTTPKSNKNTRVGGRNFFLSLGEAIPVFSAKYKIISGNKEYDAFSLATKCMEEWGKFLKKYKLT